MVEWEETKWQISMQKRRDEFSAICFFVFYFLLCVYILMLPFSVLEKYQKYLHGGKYYWTVHVDLNFNDQSSVKVLRECDGLLCWSSVLNVNPVHWPPLWQERHAAKTIGEMKQFVSKLPHLQATRQSLATRELTAVFPSMAELLAPCSLHSFMPCMIHLSMGSVHI